MHGESATNVFVENKSMFHKEVHKDGHAPVGSNKTLQKFSLVGRHSAQNLICRETDFYLIQLWPG